MLQHSYRSFLKVASVSCRARTNPTEVALGYPGEVQNGPGARLQWWAFAMCPFCYVVYTLAVGLEAATQKMPAKIAATVRGARWLTIISWSRESACC